MGGSWHTTPRNPKGSVVQYVYNTTSALATGTTTIPFDDTIPQITEGTEFMTQAITPKSTTNILVIRIVAYCSYSVAAEIIGALFQDATASALSASSQYNDTGTGRRTVVIEYSMTAGTTSATTFRFRAGGDVAGTLTFNGHSAARKLGAVAKSYMSITEIKA